MSKALRRAQPMGGDTAHLYRHDIELNGLKKIVGSPGTGGGGGGGGGVSGASFLTALDETSVLGGSFQLVGSSSITLTPVGSTIVVSTSGGGSSAALNINKVAFADSPVTVPQDTTEWSYYRGDATAGAIVFNLPRAIGSGMVVGFMKMDGTANALTPTALGADLIGDNPTFTLDTRRSVVWLADADAGQWDVVIYTPLA